MVWRLILTLLIILLIIFPTSGWFPSSQANPKRPLQHSVQMHPGEGLREIFAYKGMEVARVKVESIAHGDGAPEDNPGLDRSVNLLRSLLWRMTRGLQQLPLKSWLADLEMNIPNKGEEIAVEVDTTAMA